MRLTLVNTSVQESFTSPVFKWSRLNPCTSSNTSFPISTSSFDRGKAKTKNKKVSLVYSQSDIASKHEYISFFGKSTLPARLFLRENILLSRVTVFFCVFSFLSFAFPLVCFFAPLSRDNVFVCLSFSVSSCTVLLRFFILLSEAPLLLRLFVCLGEELGASC